MLLFWFGGKDKKGTPVVPQDCALLHTLVIHLVMLVFGPRNACGLHALNSLNYLSGLHVHNPNTWCHIKET